MREQIANTIVTDLRAITDSGRPKFVTREPFDYERLSNAQYPAILVQTSNENRQDITIGETKRQSVIEYRLICYVKSANIDTARNNLLSLIENTLDLDRTRSGNALDTQVTSVQTDEGSLDPIGGLIVTVQVLYEYVRGNS